MSHDATLPPHPTLSDYYGEERSKRGFIRRIFDQTAGDCDRVERLMAFGSGPWYRRKALGRAGLAPGMRVLDVAMGTGLVAREEARLVGDPKLVTGVDPSVGMIGQAVRSLSVSAVLGVGEQLPLADRTFDFLSMGYALRHLSDLNVAFREFRRVLKPGGRVCVLEITRPKSRAALALMRLYMRRVVPLLTRLTTRRADSQLLWQYYWDTIETCVDPERVTGSMRAAGFVDVRRHAELGIFSEYTGRRGGE